MVSNIQATVVSSQVWCTLNNPVSVSIGDAKANTITTSSSNLTTISTLSRQLSESATRAEVRDNSLSHKQLGELARKLGDQFSGDHYFASKARHDSEIPDTSDPELLERAKLATDYVNRTAGGDQAAKSPFAGLAREQLDLIAYDNSGSYTVNERRAAWYGTQDMMQEWSKKVAAQAMDEYNRTGTAQTPAVLAEMLSHYESLPRIEQAQYSEGYAAGLQSKINQGANYPGDRQDNDFLTLIEFLAQAPRAEKQPPSQFTTNN